jgi:hypothetical protein
MKRAICLIVAAAAVLSACGGDDSAPETPITTPTVEDTSGELSKEQFITQGDGICAEVNAGLGGVSEGSSSAASQRAALYDGMVERLRDLGSPDDDAGLDEFFSAADDLVDAEQSAADATEDGDDSALAAAQAEAGTAAEDFSEAAASYGFEDCGQGATSTVTAPTAPATAAPVTPAAPVPTTPTAPAAPAPAPAPDPGTTGTGGGTTGGGTAGGTGGGSSGSGGVGPG